MGNHILLLEQLLSTSAVVTPEVKERALKLAIKWGMDLKTNNAESLKVLGFLHLVAAYKLAPNFDKNEILNLIETCSLLDKAPELCHTLGYSGEGSS